MTNPPQEPGESVPGPEESGKATSEQESAMSDSPPAAESDPADPDTEPTAADPEPPASDSPAGAAPPPPTVDQPPPKSRKGRIAAVVLVVTLVLAGGGVALYLVNRSEPGTPTAARAGSGASATPTSESGVYDDYYDDYSDESSTESSSPNGSDFPEYDDYGDYGDYGETSEEDEPARDIRDIDDGAATSDDPDEVRLAYMAAYENKEFSEVVENACTAYKDRFGTDTQELEDALADFDVTATEDGDLDRDGNTATGLIDIELSSADNTDNRKILVKLVEERGKWRFCGEDEG